ncbi:ImmA/IrrE family metallo-endopeptidase [Pediococcus claussenii]|uniref:ImmA/IrrE family metallo-endopeptidase n=1 Tax=Pediococcus claussenii TaxID=187452 RepID=UPI00081A7309|nr:ImmA/IrrE family metallo-endopeptidase [Pediococcus claussenii]ANZ70338.1 hypothetical protein AYR57_08430 [Pediococcus claussenii]ANZ72154.1 hypothetical protein AYR58_08430 [Pediococcus claussenii]
MDDLLAYLRDYAFKNHIGYEFSNFHNPDRAPKSITYMKMIFMNSNWKNKEEIPFQFAHEISHILNGDSGSNNFSASSIYMKEEYKANARAAEILMEYSDLNNLSFYDSVSFMNAFGIPSKARYVVDDVFRERFGVNYKRTDCAL